MDGGAWWATFHRIVKSWTLLSMHEHTHTHTEHNIEEYKLSSHKLIILKVKWLIKWTFQEAIKHFHIYSREYISSIQFSCSVVSDSLWPHGLQHVRPPCPSPTPRVYPNYVHWTSDAIQPSHPLSSPSPPIFSLCQHQGLFKWVNSLHQVAKYWSFSFSTSPSNEYSGLISFRIDWLDLLAVQGILKTILQNHSSKASIHQCSAFFIIQLSHLYMTTGKTTALTRHTFVVKVMSLLFSMLSRLVITFLLRS